MTIMGSNVSTNWLWPFNISNLDKRKIGFGKTVKEYLAYFSDFNLDYPWQLLALNQQAFDQSSATFIHPKAEVSELTKIVGPVYIDEDVQVGDFVKIIGPVYVGKGTTINSFILIREYTCLGQEVKIGAHSEIKNSLIGDGTHLHRNYIGDSIIGSNCRIGAGTVTGNRRIDRSVISSLLNGQKIQTGLSSLGVMVGDNTKIGINCSTMPGIKIGSNVAVWPQLPIFKDILDGRTIKALTDEK